MKERSYIAIDLKSFYASVECRERNLDPLDTNLVVADESRTDKTICLAVTPSLKSYGISGRGRLFEIRQRIREVNGGRRHDAQGHRLNGSSCFSSELQANPSLAVDFIIAPPRMACLNLVTPTMTSTKQPKTFLCQNTLDIFRRFGVFFGHIFATAYLYPLCGDDSSSCLSPDPDLMRKRTLVLKQHLHSCYPDMELWITEFNSNISSRNLLNDSCYQSLFLAKNLTELARLGVKAAGYYLMSDLSLRYADTLDFFFGGWGLFSDLGIPKPSYYTYHLLSNLGSELLEAGKTYLITKNLNRQYSCLFQTEDKPGLGEDS